MNLLDSAKETCTMLTETTTADGYGGHTRVFTDGAEFEAAITIDADIEAQVADKMSVSSRYTVTTTRDIVLVYRDVFRRERDSKLFRVTSDGDDKYTPASAGLDMRQVTAEEFFE